LLSVKAISAVIVLMLIATAVAGFTSRASTQARRSLPNIPCVGVGAGVLGGGQEIEVCPPVAPVP